MAKLTPESCRAARALLRWSVRDLGEASSVRFETISIFESTNRPMRQGTASKIIAAFEVRGVELLNGDRPGARLNPEGRAPAAPDA